MAPPPELIGSDGEENQSDATSNLTKIFSDNGSDSDSSSNPELNSEVSDEDKPINNTFDIEDQLPPEHYLAQAESRGPLTNHQRSPESPIEKFDAVTCSLAPSRFTILQQ